MVKGDKMERCRGCVYWRSSTGGQGIPSLYLCHHLLDTGKRRIDQDGECLSKTIAGQQVKDKPVKAPRESKCKKKVKAVEDNIVFESMKAAEKHYKLAHGRVSEVANDPNKTARGQHFITV